HPLHVAGAEVAPIAETVAVRHVARQHVGDRLDTAVWMPGKAREVVLWLVIAKVVEQQKGIEVGGVAEAERALQLHACPFDCRLRLNNPLDRSDRHGGSPLRIECVSLQSSARLHEGSVPVSCGAETVSDHNYTIYSHYR